MMHLVTAVWISLAACGDDGVHDLPDAPASEAVSSGVTLVTQINGTASASAGFFGMPVQYTCGVATHGACVVFACGDPTVTTPYDGAGAVAITGGTPPQDLALVKSASNLYSLSGVVGAGAAFTGGSVVTMTGAGDVVPAFSQTVTFPDRAQLDLPAIGGTAARTSDLTVAWSTATGNDNIYFNVATPTALIACVFPTAGAASGSGTIPAAALAALPAGAATLSAAAYASTTVNIGAYRAGFNAGGELYNATHSTSFGGTFTFD